MYRDSTEMTTVQPESLYPLSVLKGVTGWGDASLRIARRNGLRVHYVGRQGFVKGSEFIKYVEQVSRSER